MHDFLRSGAIPIDRVGGLIWERNPNQISCVYTKDTKEIRDL